MKNLGDRGEITLFLCLLIAGFCSLTSFTIGDDVGFRRPSKIYYRQEGETVQLPNGISMQVEGPHEIQVVMKKPVQAVYLGATGQIPPPRRKFWPSWERTLYP